jgi:hypothetical protein
MKLQYIHYLSTTTVSLLLFLIIIIVIKKLYKNQLRCQCGKDCTSCTSLNYHSSCKRNK